MSVCERCGADLDAGEAHRVDQGQHDVTGVLTVELPVREWLAGMVRLGE